MVSPAGFIRSLNRRTDALERRLYSFRAVADHGGGHGRRIQEGGYRGQEGALAEDAAAA